jgi:hypothetical protein
MLKHPTFRQQIFAKLKIDSYLVAMIFAKKAVAGFTVFSDFGIVITF